MASGLNFESVVARFYEPLYQFAFGLTRVEADACDLTQQTFYVWATKGHQLRDQTKVKTWLFTTLHRAFLESRRRQVRFPHYELDEVPLDLPTLSPATVNELDSPQVLEALSQVDEIYQAPGRAVLSGRLPLQRNRRDPRHPNWHRQIPHGPRHRPIAKHPHPGRPGEPSRIEK